MSGLRICSASAVSALSATVSEGASGHTWLDGLRGTGGITIPVADRLLGRLDNLFFYVVLLWALDGAAEVRDWSPEVARAVTVAREAVLTVVTGLAVVAFIGFAFDLSTALLRDPDGQGYVAAGPLGLLVGGAALAWPLSVRGNEEPYLGHLGDLCDLGSGLGKRASMTL